MTGKNLGKNMDKLPWRKVVRWEAFFVAFEQANKDEDISKGAESAERSVWTLIKLQSQGIISGLTMLRHRMLRGSMLWEIRNSREGC